MWLDDVISYFSPSAGARRIAARQALDQMRSFDGAKISRRTADWKATSSSANAEILPALAMLRNRSRDLIRNNAYATAMVETWVSSLVGTGILAKFAQAKAQKLWLEWSAQCDADGGLNFEGLQGLVARTLVESGEVLIRFRPRKSTDGLAVPFQIQVMEPDYLDHTKNEQLADGGWIDMGVEFSAIGTIKGYHLFERHPGDQRSVVKANTSRFIPASEIIHLFERTRPGQVRGVPRLAPVLLSMRDIDDVEDSTLMRKKVEACLAAFVTTDDPNHTLGQDKGADANGRRSARIAPGQIERLRPGESVTFSTPPSSSGYSDYMRTQLRKAASGFGVMYEHATGDLSQVNFSSMRAGNIEFRRRIERAQWLTFIPLFCERVARRFLTEAVAAGRLTSERVAIEWTTPKFDQVDPVKETTADLLEIAAGLQSWQANVRRRGADPATLLQQIKEDQQAFAEAGISIQIDKLALGAASRLPPDPDQDKPTDPAAGGV